MHGIIEVFGDENYQSLRMRNGMVPACHMSCPPLFFNVRPVPIYVQPMMDIFQARYSSLLTGGYSYAFVDEVPERLNCHPRKVCLQRDACVRMIHCHGEIHV